MNIYKSDLKYQLFFLVFVYWMSNSINAETFSQAELDQYIASTKQQYETCSHVLTKADRNDAHFDAINKCAHICSNTYNALRRASASSRPVKKSRISDSIKQCNDFYAQLSSDQQNDSPPVKKTPEDAPNSESAIIADLKKFSQEFKVMASKLSGRGDKRTADVNARSCEGYATYIQKHGLNDTSKQYWPFCYNNLTYMKNIHGLN